MARPEGSRYFYIALECNDLHQDRGAVPSPDCMSKFYTDFDKCLKDAQNLSETISGSFRGTYVQSDSPGKLELLRLTIYKDGDWLARCSVWCEDTRGQTIH